MTTDQCDPHHREAIEAVTSIVVLEEGAQIGITVVDVVGQGHHMAEMGGIGAAAPSEEIWMKKQAFHFLEET